MNQYVIQSALRTLQVLLAFGKPPHRFGLSDLMLVTPFEKNQLYRSLRTLEAAGFIVADSGGRYTVTPVVNVLSAASAHGRPLTLVEVASPHLDALAEETGRPSTSTCSPATRPCASTGARAPTACGSRPSSARRTHCTPGLVPRPSSPSSTRSCAPRSCGSSIPTPATPPPRSATALLARELELTRERGYSISDGDFDDNAKGIGAPVFDGPGQVVGAISIGGPSFRVGEEELTRYTPLIIRVAKAISNGLGYSG